MSSTLGAVGQGRRGLEDVERRARVAATDVDQVLKRVVGAAPPDRQDPLIGQRTSTTVPRSSSESGSRRNTRSRDRSAELTSK